MGICPGTNTSAAEAMILLNEALTQSNDVAKNTNSHPTVTVAPGCLPWILDQIGKDEIFQGHLLRAWCWRYGKSNTLESLEDKLS